MDVEFEFKEKNGGACVTKLLAPGAVCVVPESLGGLPVTELADKVFSGSTVEKVYLPRTLTRIGRYEFYGCEKLQEIHFYGALREVGGGVFTGCRNIRSLTVHMGVDEESALRDFVTEINERVTVHVFIQSGQNRMQDERDTDSARTSLASSTFEEENGETETARVIFPEYYDEAVENTPARITVSNIHGVLTVRHSKAAVCRFRATKKRRIATTLLSCSEAGARERYSIICCTFSFCLQPLCQWLHRR